MGGTTLRTTFKVFLATVKYAMSPRASSQMREKYVLKTKKDIGIYEIKDLNVTVSTSLNDICSRVYIIPMFYLFCKILGEGVLWTYVDTFFFVQHLRWSDLHWDGLPSAGFYLFKQATPGNSMTAHCYIIEQLRSYLCKLVFIEEKAVEENHYL